VTTLFLGTFTSTVVVGFIMYAAGTWGISFPFTLRDAMLFASLISSTDPVTTLSIFSDMGMDPDLHAVVLGESLMNDAISIVLFEALLSFASAGAGGGGGRGGGGAGVGLDGAMAAAALGLVDGGGGGVGAEAIAAAGGAGAIGVSAIGAEVAFSELAVTSLGVFLGVFFASLAIGSMVGACSVGGRHSRRVSDWLHGPHRLSSIDGVSDQCKITL
jgi:NhaP-type Na+/H+ or K+/H+ antiporter